MKDNNLVSAVLQSLEYMSKRSTLCSLWVMLWTEYSQHYIIIHHIVHTFTVFCHSYPSYFPHRTWLRTFLSFDIISLDSTCQHPTVKTYNGIAQSQHFSHCCLTLQRGSCLPSGTSLVMFKVIWFGSAVTGTEKAASLASLLFDDGFAVLNWAKIFTITVMVYQQVPTPFFRAFGNDSFSICCPSGS